MRVGQWTPTLFHAGSVVGGGERYVENVAKALRLTGDPQDEVMYLAPSHRSSTEVAAAGYRLLHCVDWDHNVPSVTDAEAAMEGLDAVIVHQCLLRSGLVIASVAARMGITVVGFDHGGGHDSDVWGKPHLVSQYNAFVAQSDFAALAFLDVATPTHVIKGPVDDEFFRPLGEGQSTAENHLLSVGRLLPHKGFETVIQACEPDSKLIIVGTRHDADYESWLVGIAASRGVTLEVIEGPSDTELRKIYGSARAVVQASTHTDFRGRKYAKPELLGLAPLEALACGTRTFVRRTAALGELSELPGCRAFDGPQEVRDSLRLALTPPSQVERSLVRASVVASYGLEQFGRSLWQLLIK